MKLIILVIVFLFLCGCGDSPFLNNTPAAETDNSKSLSTNNTEFFFQSEKLSLNFLWLEGPHLNKQSKLLVIFRDQLGNTADPNYEFKSHLYMPRMNPPHGTAKFKIKRVGIGVYEVSRMFFTMGGYWELHFRLNDGSKDVEEYIWPIDM